MVPDVPHLALAAIRGDLNDDITHHRAVLRGLPHVDGQVGEGSIGKLLKDVVGQLRSLGPLGLPRQVEHANLPGVHIVVLRKFVGEKATPIQGHRNLRRESAQLHRMGPEHLPGSIHHEPSARIHGRGAQEVPRLHSLRVKLGNVEFRHRRLQDPCSKHPLVARVLHAIDLSHQAHTDLGHRPQPKQQHLAVGPVLWWCRSITAPLSVLHPGRALRVQRPLHPQDRRDLRGSHHPLGHLFFGPTAHQPCKEEPHQESVSRKVS